MAVQDFQVKGTELMWRNTIDGAYHQMEINGLTDAMADHNYIVAFCGSGKDSMAYAIDPSGVFQAVIGSGAGIYISYIAASEKYPVYIAGEFLQKGKWIGSCFVYRKGKGFLRKSRAA